MNFPGGLQVNSPGGLQVNSPVGLQVDSPGGLQVDSPGGVAQGRQLLKAVAVYAPCGICCCCRCSLAYI